MSARRRLVSRQTGSTAGPVSSPSNPRHSTSTTAAQSGIVQPPQIPALPPYEAPSYPLTVSGKRALENITSSHDYKKYKKHLEVAIKNVTIGAAESNDLLYGAKDYVRKLAEKREEQGTEKSEREELMEVRAKELEDKVVRLTSKAEKALRELIDLGDEIAQQEIMLTEVSERAATSDSRAATGGASGSQRRRTRNALEDEDDDEDADYADQDMTDVPTTQATLLSPTELFAQAKESYIASYAAKSMREKYVHHISSVNQTLY